MGAFGVGEGIGELNIYIYIYTSIFSVFSEIQLKSRDVGTFLFLFFFFIK